MIKNKFVCFGTKIIADRILPRYFQLRAVNFIARNWTYAAKIYAV